MTLYVGASAPVASDFIVSSRFGETDAVSGLPVVAPDLTEVTSARCEVGPTLARDLEGLPSVAAALELGHVELVACEAGASRDAACESGVTRRATLPT